MDSKIALIKLYYLLVHADGEVNEREVTLGNHMTQVEGILESDFKSILESLKDRDRETIFSEGVAALKKLDHQKKVRYVAWLCLVANADGFMDKAEWQFIYKIYNTELKLNLDEIMKVQKELLTLTTKRTLSFSILL
ncbi:MAG TPA: hypothetical protein DGG95_05240 [Cytophagales bacterium]|jgi:uncharacterized tellurite resistance protein B-like protein|nr:hypothetical protein [Cytophagales bacterium]